MKICGHFLFVNEEQTWQDSALFLRGTIVEASSYVYLYEMKKSSFLNILTFDKSFIIMNYQIEDIIF